MPRILIIVPCFNEEVRLDRARLRAFARSGDDVAFLFVDDGSTDQTRPLLEALCAEQPDRFALLALPRNRGKAEAVRQGMLRGLTSSPDYIGFWDADLATPLEAIHDLSRVLDERPDVEMVFGARLQLLGRNIERRATRHYAGRVFATAVSNLLGLRIYDTQCGAKLFRRTPDLALLFRDPFVSRWIFDVEIIARLIRARRGSNRPRAAEVIYEYPLFEWRDVRGSKIGAFDFVRAAFDLLRIYWRYLRRSG
jgi:glycosyltransferase involved in cell wall biosynthesis